MRSLLFAPKTKQFSHQKEVLEKTWDLPGYALWWEPGTGKSKGFLDNGCALYCERMVNGLFLLAPNGLHRNFIAREVPKHLPDDIAEKCKSLFWHNAKSKTKTWQNEAADFLKPGEGLKILAMSYDGITTELGKKLAKQFLTENRCLYGADESQRIKDLKAWRTQVVLGSAPYAPFRRIMTGTPIANAPWDAYTQIKFIDDTFWRPHGLDSPEAMKAAFGEWEKTAKRVPVAMLAREKGFNHYYEKNNVPEELRTTFVRKAGGVCLQMVPALARDMDGTPRYKNLDRLRQILEPIRSRVLKEDVFDLPAKMYSPVEFDMSPKQRAAYESLKKLGFAVLDGYQVSSDMAMTILLRLQQIACGYLVSDLEPGQEDPTILPIEPNPRLELLGEIAEDLSHQAIIWARFTPDVDSIMEKLKKLGKTAVRYDGRVGDDERAQNEDMFHRGEAQFFVSKASTGGEGLTLNEAKTHIYYSNTFKLIERLQSEDRSHRYGQDTRVNYIDLIARDTIDERLIRILQAKMDVSAMVVGDNLKSWLLSDRLL